MTFINWYILFGLAAIAIPILIHLFNRRRARVIDWGAMQFLKGSLVNRKRRILIEELILMALRCLLLAVMILAIARPFSPVGSRISWLVLLPAILICAVLLAVATIVSRRPGLRWLWIACAAAIIGGVVYLSQNEQLLQASRWKSTTDQDVAIIIDGSSSMQIEIDGKSNFSRAVDEARLLLSGLGRGDEATVLIAGSVIRPLTREPQSVRGNLDQLLQDCQPVGGQFSAPEAIAAAAEQLAAGDQAAKKIVIISDGQNLGWDTDSDSRWQFVSDTLAYLPTKPKIVTRFLPLPSKFDNAAIASVELSRQIIGTDRPVTIRVRVENTGFDPIKPAGVKLQIDDRDIATSQLTDLAVGQSEQVNFDYRFESAGMHTVTVSLLSEDALAVDNQQTRVAQVYDRLPVLLVDGSGNQDPFLQSTNFIEIALAPPDDEAIPGGESAAGKPVIQQLVATKVVSPTDLQSSVHLDDYQVVMLIDVPRVNQQVADRLAKFVARGGGLLVAVGKRSQPEFFNQWKTDAGATMLPGALQQQVAAEPKSPPRFAAESFQHPAMRKLVESGEAKVGDTSIESYWRISLEPSADVQTAAAFESGDPFIAFKQIGKGKVALSAMALDNTDSNFASQLVFLPFIHELTYDLAAPATINLNYAASDKLKITLPIRFPGNQEQSGNAADSAEAPSETLLVTTPDGQTITATLQNTPERTTVSFDQAAMPGVYRLQLPDDLSRRLATNALSSNASSTKAPEENRAALETTLPISIAVTEAESRLQPLSEFERKMPARFVDYFSAATVEQMTAAVVGDVPGHELWKYLAIGAVMILLAESFVTRWIATQRKTGTVETVSFVSEGERLSTFQARAQELLSTVRNR
jgi:hypothetical protein